MPRPIDRERLRAELLRAGRLLTEPLAEPSPDAYRLGGLEILLGRIAWEAGLPEVAEEIATMIRARRDWVIAGYRERTVALAPLASDEAKQGDVSDADEVAYLDSLDDADRRWERDRRTSEVAT